MKPLAEADYPRIAAERRAKLGACPELTHTLDCRCHLQGGVHNPRKKDDTPPEDVRPTAPATIEAAPLPYVLIIRLPMPPTLTNSGDGRSRHWTALEREKEAYWAECDAVAPRRTAEPIRRARLYSTMILAGGMDDDGAVSRHKWPIDWLVLRRYLSGDRRKYLTWAAMPSQIVTRRFLPELILTLLPETT